jgi:hypothetical protein
MSTPDQNSPSHYTAKHSYFYTQLRGSTPVAKALAFGVAVLATEVLPIFSITSDETSSSILTPASPDDLLLAAIIRIGQVIVFFATVGLLWNGGWQTAQAAVGSASEISTT